MTLNEFYEYANESQNIKVISSDDSKVLGYYDGKNSIDNTEQKNGFMLNDCEVDRIEADGKVLIVSVNDWF